MTEPTIYILFSYPTYYPEGGADDFVALTTAPDNKAALDWVLSIEGGIDERWHLAKLDGETLEPIFEGFGTGDGRIAATTAIPADVLNRL